MGYQGNNGYIEVLSNFFSVNFNVSEEFTDKFGKENLQIFFAASEREEILQQRLKDMHENRPNTGGGPDLINLCAPIVMTVCSSQNIQYILNSCLSGALWDLIKFISLKLSKQFLLKKETKYIPFHLTIHKDTESAVTDIVISTSMSEEQISNCVRDAIIQGLQ